MQSFITERNVHVIGAEQMNTIPLQNIWRYICYSADYMSQSRDQQRFTISGVAADWL